MVSWVVEQLLSCLDVACFLFWSPLVALIVLDAVVRVREDAVGLRAGEVDGRRVRLAWPSIAVPCSAADLLGEVAPLMDVIVQVVSLAEHVTGAAFIALPVHGAVFGVFVEEGSVAVRADLVVGQRVRAVADGGCRAGRDGHRRQGYHCPHHPDYLV